MWWKHRILKLKVKRPLPMRKHQNKATPIHSDRWVWLLKCDDQQLVKENWLCWHMTQRNVFLLIVLFRSKPKNVGLLGGSAGRFERVNVCKSWKGVCLCASVPACARLVHLCCWPLGVQLIPNYLSGGWHHLPPSHYTQRTAGPCCKAAVICHFG